jgi:hypothetical protein
MSHARAISNLRDQGVQPRMRPCCANEDCLPSELLFRCPHTNRPVSSGVWTDRKALALASKRGGTMRLPCPHCGMGHDLDIREGFLSCSPCAGDDLFSALPVVGGATLAPYAEKAEQVSKISVEAVSKRMSGELQTVRIATHRQNLARYRAILSSDLMPYERAFIEQRLAEERAALGALAGPSATTEFS